MLSHFNNKQLLRGYSERPQPELSHLNESQQKDGNLPLWPFTGLISKLATVDHNCLRWGCMGNSLHLQIQIRTAVLVLRALIIVRETHDNVTLPHWIFYVDEGLNLSAYNMKHIFGVFLRLWCWVLNRNVKKSRFLLLQHSCWLDLRWLQTYTFAGETYVNHSPQIESLKEGKGKKIQDKKWFIQNQKQEPMRSWRFGKQGNKNQKSSTSWYPIHASDPELTSYTCANIVMHLMKECVLISHLQPDHTRFQPGQNLCLTWV